MKKIFTIVLLWLAILGFSQTPIEFNRPVKFTAVNESEVNGVYGFTPAGVMGWIKKSDLLVHNDLTGLQGGTVGQMYHLSQAQYDWVKAQLYTNHSATFTLATASGERGVNLTNTVNYNIASNDDIITGATINQSIGNVLPNVNTGNKTATAPSTAETTTYTLAINYTRNGVAGNQNRNATYTAYNPQWYGSSATKSDVLTTDYSSLNVGAGFTKYVGSATAMTFNANISTPAYVWFISTVNTNKITASGFDTTIGNWGDASAFFWKKALPGFVLANGTTTATLYLYRTRVMQNTGGSTIPFVFNP
ncbi:hypothetical protein ACI6PS_03610 [Flavobacterium sp. PLA-1-15]|uniref:hypothetical protein n=1 Tax=Flavobacterium sp. PLA-1-15 TaxID=3380533 RepID=UPI003B7B9183